ncbi:hypothetical protein [Hymenobacter cellulosivorans]|uniref:Uncharacterized protein n=1 Tax=Hymenobacter cellulosivorans TaxID=2932249 RepID=A0ABY4F9T6_9BACT|nr:hypothetical protein [Hymenobacter cellulosivorans]UOQ51221.1 hypothetical protein MUN80_15775 [Hymenobacter cellulosivorans]
MKTSLISRLSMLAVVLGLSISAATAQPTIYTEDAKQPGAGYWTIETDAAQRDHSIVRFYTANHEKIYEERLDALHLDPSKGTAAARRTARMLNNALVQVQQTRNTSMISKGLGLNRRLQQTYAVR